MKNLTQQRYLVIADYPYSPFNVGSILTKITPLNNDTYWVNNKLYTDRHPEKYPHLFRLLHWWEYRDEKELPEYVKGFGNQILKVQKWVLRKNNFIAFALEDTIEYQFNASSCEPATLNEYNEYIKNK